MYELSSPPGVKGLKGLKNSLKKFVTQLIFSIFTNLQVGKYAEYCISSNKHQASNKHSTYQFQNLISPGGSVTDVFHGILWKIFRTAISKSNCIFMQWTLSKKQMGYSKTK